MGSGKNRWKISFHRSHSSLTPKPIPQIPPEFLCPISNTLMSDPVITPSGHTFDRVSILACKSLSYTPTLSHHPTPNFSILIPNLALKSTILNFNHPNPPKTLDFISVVKIIQSLKASESSSSSVDSFSPPSFYSSSSSSEIENDELTHKIKSEKVYEQEEALVSLREITRTQEKSRGELCTIGLLSALKGAIVSRYAAVQENAVAALVNLSLEEGNKVKIVRAGVVPFLVEVLKGGSELARENAAGAIFSLSLDDQNKTAIGVLGALPVLIHALRSDSEKTQNDASSALYHLTRVESNRVKMVRFGGVHVLLGMVREGHMVGRILLALCNLTSSAEGRAAMLDGGAVECFVGMLGRGGFEESCVSALYGLSYGGLRFKGLAIEAGAEEVLNEMVKKVNERVRDKARRILEVMREKNEAEEEIDWEELLNSGEVTETRFRLSCGMDVSQSNAIEF